MSDNTERPAQDARPPVPPDAGSEGTPEEKPDAQPANQGNGDGAPPSEEDPREALLRTIDKSLLTPELKAQILAELPPPEEMERMYREMQENGGLSSEEFFASLFGDAEPQP